MDSADHSESFGGLHLKGILHGNFNVMPEENSKFWVDAKVRGVQILECSRSLQTFDREFEISFRVEVKRSPGCEKQVLDDSDESVYRVTIGPHARELDFSECIRQEILLSEPMSPVADDSDIARGNFSWESTLKKEVDPRWEGLKDLWKENSK